MPRGVKGSGPKAKGKKSKLSLALPGDGSADPKPDGRKGKRRRGHGAIIRKIAELFGQLPPNKAGEVLSAMVTLHVD